MRIEWEPIVQTIVAETNNELNRPRKQKLLVDWRAKLGKEPTLLQPHQIDVIVREVRRRLEGATGTR